ncbi:hypothetical protein GCM10015534_57150 [Streptomyces diastaticus subsp. diastaticus]|nr:hypothetical protein GCM10015534_57150 [Streptomyces diastaticus subsp. diastaticus]
MQQGTLAGPAAAGDRHDLSRHERQVDAPHGTLSAVADLNVHGTEYGGGLGDMKELFLGW